MTTHADDQPLLGSGTSAADGAPRVGRRSADVGGTLRPRRIQPPDWGRHPSSRDMQRYYLCSEEPSGEFVEVIIPVTDAGRRRYFATSDGERLTEVDEDYFVGRGEGNARSLLELDAREMAELQAELNFVRPVLGRDPLAEVAAEAAAAEAETAVTDAETAVTDAAEQVSAAPVPAAAVPPQISPPQEAPAEPVDAEPPAVDAENDDDDDDEETIEENHVVMGTSVFEGVEPASSVPPFDPAPNPVAAPVDAPTHAAPAHAAPAHAAPTEAAHVDAAHTDSTPDLDAAAQVSLAKGIAFVAHRGQLDEVGAEYIDHPGRVAERFDPLTEPVPTAVAWLHDVLEDTAVTAQELLEAGVLPEIVELVQLLTRTPDVSDDDYYARIRRHPVALRVKLADLDDNTAPWRVRRLDYDVQLRLAEKYRHAREVLGA